MTKEEREIIEKYFSHNGFLKGTSSLSFSPFNDSFVEPIKITDKGFNVKKIPNINCRHFLVPYSLVMSFNELRKRAKHIDEVVNKLLPQYKGEYLVSFILSHVLYGVYKSSLINTDLIYKFIRQPLNHPDIKFATNHNTYDEYILTKEEENEIWGNV